jgi:hypothetical protein
MFFQKTKLMGDIPPGWPAGGIYPPTREETLPSQGEFLSNNLGIIVKQIFGLVWKEICGWAVGRFSPGSKDPRFESWSYFYLHMTSAAQLVHQRPSGV